MLNRTKEDYLNLLQETVDYYSEDVTRRGVTTDGRCLYLSPLGGMCAVGRCISDPKGFEEITMKIGLGSISNINLHKDIDFESLLQEKYRGFGIEMWKKLQAFHDNDAHWDENGITDSGLTESYVSVEKIKEYIEGIDFESELKEEYRGYDIEMWAYLQGFHDKNENWDLN